ncbi:DUF3747 domain-containing protein [Lusitaniella coriacea]|uniref:DUF3747 domain-containing protein n=1 Tax=Lusitaniella coriacea TaxID=1983105 RepID=UPI003CEB93B5
MQRKSTDRLFGIKGIFAAIFAISTVFLVESMRPAIASLFGTIEIEQNRLIALASPFGRDRGHYQLLILEQLSNARPCWREFGSNPVRVEPLLLNFDFTGICDRATNGNNYSIRIGGEDLGGRYLLSIVRRGNDLVLIGSSLLEPNTPPIEIGRTNGIIDGYQKIVLNPGWRFTQRTYRGKTLHHIYLTGDTTVVDAPPTLPTTVNLPLPNRPLPTPQRELIFTPSPSPSEPVPLPPVSPPPQQSPGRTIPAF